MRTVIALLNHAGARTGDPDLSLHLAEHAELGSFDLHVYAILSSPTLRAGYERLVRYQRLIHETSQVELAVAGKQAILRHRLPGGLAVPRQSAEFIVACWVRAGRAAIGQDFAPIEVRFAHPAPPVVTAHARFFRAPVRFASGENSIVLSTALLDTPCVRADPAAALSSDRHALTIGGGSGGRDIPSGDALGRRSSRSSRGAAADRRPTRPTFCARRPHSTAPSLPGTSYRELWLSPPGMARHRRRSIGDCRVAFLLGFLTQRFLPRFRRGPAGRLRRGPGAAGPHLPAPRSPPDPGGAFGRWAAGPMANWLFSCPIEDRDRGPGR
jgi:hypothetical protein